MSRRTLVILSIVVLLAATVWYFGTPKTGRPYSLDADVEERYLAGRTQVDAVEFFERGGLYESVEFDSTDSEHVLPLIKRLRDEFQLKPVIALDSPGQAFGLFVEVPSDPELRRKIGAVFQEADDKFPGLLTDHWGKKWVSLDWLEGMELEALRDSQALDLIRNEHERIRKNP